MRRAHVFVSGFVQGVGYRVFVRHKAEKLGIKGWVANLPDGRVEAVLVGNEETIRKLIQKLHEGPMLSEIKDVVVDWEDSDEEFLDFFVKHET